MILNQLSDKFVFKTLKYIKYGHLKLTNFNGDVYYFGNEKEDLKAQIKIKAGTKAKLSQNGKLN